MSQLYNDKQDLDSRYLQEAAEALQARPYELLMPPEQAMALRGLRRDALRVIETAKPLDENQRTGTEG